MPRCLAAALFTALILSAQPPDRHYLVAVTASSSLASPSAGVGIVFFDRGTLHQFAQLGFPAKTYPVATSPDGRTVYLALFNGIAAVDVATFATTTILTIPGLQSAQPAGASHLLARTANGILLVDPAARSTAGPVSCPFTPEGLLYYPPTQTTYGYSSTSQNLCVIGPDFQLAPSIPLGRTVTSARLLDNGDAGMLLVSTWDNVSAYNTIALDLRTLQSFPVLSLNGALPGFAAPRNPRVWYGTQHPNYLTNLLQRYAVTFAADGTPVFTPQLDQPPAITAVAAIDDRYVYISVIGYCSSLEGLIEGCPYGFRILDAFTLQPRAQNGSLVIAPLLSYGYYGPQTLALALSGAPWIPPPHPRLH
jgi:hypothetical protein